MAEFTEAEIREALRWLEVEIAHPEPVLDTHINPDDLPWARTILALARRGAAAPDLLEAAREAHEALMDVVDIVDATSGEDALTVREALTALDTAIAKARGAS